MITAQGNALSASEAENKQITMGDVDGTKAYEAEIEKGGRKSLTFTTSQILNNRRIRPKMLFEMKTEMK